MSSNSKATDGKLLLLGILWPVNGFPLELPLSIMAINRLGSHTGKKRHTSSVRLAEFYLNPFTLVGYRNNRSCLSHKSLYFKRYATVPIVIFLNIVKFFYEIL